MSANQLLVRHRSLAADPISNLVGKVQELAATRSFQDRDLTAFAVSTEGLESAQAQVLSSTINNLESSLHTLAAEVLGKKYAVEEYQYDAATVGGILAADPAKFLSSKPSLNQNGQFIPLAMTDGFDTRPLPALEAYDERDNRNAQTYSIVYNLLASRQDDFGETFFPTIVVNPNEVGITVSAKLFYTYNDFKRSVTGTLAKYSRKNVVRAYADFTILNNELTRAIPVLRVGGSDDNTAVFAALTDVPAWTETILGDTTVTTAALKMGKNVDLIGLSQTNDLLNSGVMGPSDTLDTYLKIKQIFLKTTDGTNTDVFAVDVENLPGSNFTYAPQGNYRKMLLNLDSDGVVLTATTTNLAGTDLSTSSLGELAGRKARVRLSANGNLLLDKSDCVVNAGQVELLALRDATDNLVTGATFDTLAAKLAAATVLGYSLVAYRANTNLRQRGQLLDSQIENQIIQLPYRSPLSVIMPSMNNGTEDNSALQTLITVTGIRTSNAAVTSLLDAQVALSGYQPVADADGNLPEVAAVGRYYTPPTYFYESMDLTTVVDSLKSHEKIKDIRAALVEKIRYYANEMYRTSEYKAAALVLTGNAGYKPTIIVGTDPLLFNYIMSDGDLRTLGEGFDLKVVSTLDKRVKGKIFISFGVFDGSRNTAINPLNFGNMLWSPELTVVMPISRDGQVSKELIVAPRFAHIVTLPVMTMIDVAGLPTVVNKVTVNYHQIP